MTADEYEQRRTELRAKLNRVLELALAEEDSKLARQCIVDLACLDEVGGFGRQPKPPRRAVPSVVLRPLWPEPKDKQ